MLVQMNSPLIRQLLISYFAEYDDFGNFLRNFNNEAVIARDFYYSMFLIAFTTRRVTV